MDILSSMIILAFVLVLYLQVSVAANYLNSINVSQSISDDGKTLVSNSGVFELGFFSPGNSAKRYLGIWYKNYPAQTVVWVANRVNFINDSFGILTLSSTGNLVLSQNDTVVWNTSSKKEAKNPMVVLLDTGNLVIRNEGEENPESYLWQSFDYPCDTFLPGMKLGWDLRNGLERRLTSWMSPDDPSPGQFYRSLVRNSYPEMYLMNGTKKFFRQGPWNGLYFSGTPIVSANLTFYSNYVSNKDELFYMYGPKNKSILIRTVVNQTRYVSQGFRWIEGAQTWKTTTPIPADTCDTYSLCGVHGICLTSELPLCKCLKGFSPKSPQAWFSSDWTQGCVRNEPLNCVDKHKDGFVKFVGLKVPDTSHTLLDETIGLEECGDKCLDNCSCMAYANSDIRGEGSGCVMWFGDLIDIKKFPTEGQDLYIRMSAREIVKSKPQETVDSRKNHTRKVVAVVAIIVAAVSGILLLSACFIYRIRNNIAEHPSIEHTNERHVDDLDIPLFDLPTLTIATGGFSIKNKIGEGGFGPVYKGILPDGQQIAVKTRSRSSQQGLTEIINEVKLIAKLQHRNLVNLLGCCIQGQEKMLVYEYMANGSLDYFIFDDTRGKLLEWPIRFHIICGIARGLIYLHQDSRLRIIHRDLKASNVLLDENLSPKLSDFGIARTFGGDQTEGINTNRIAGTYGYMAPEYAVDGLFSAKSDVFSFGILLLEIICGKKNKGLYQIDESLNLVGHAWTMWKEDRALELIDTNVKESCIIPEVLRCLHVSLLCVQQYPEDRPTMASVILMLESQMDLIEPREHGFISRNFKSEADLRLNLKDTSSTNEVTITLLEAR